MNWIRTVPSIYVTHEPWHVVLSVTTSGLRLTACGEVFAPEDGAETAPPMPETEVRDRCERCHVSAQQTSPGFLLE